MQSGRLLGFVSYDRVPGACHEDDVLAQGGRPSRPPPLSLAVRRAAMCADWVSPQVELVSPARRNRLELVGPWRSHK
jgi:hypothetical protein